MTEAEIPKDRWLTNEVETLTIPPVPDTGSPREATVLDARCTSGMWTTVDAGQQTNVSYLFTYGGPWKLT
jgi:hypothetical protein